MNAASLIGHVTELLRLIDGSRQPPDRTVSAFLKERHYLGARDRRAVSESVYGMIRSRRYLEAILEEFTLRHPEHAEIETRPTRYLLLYLIFTTAIAGASSPSGEALPEMPGGLWSSMFPKADLEETKSWITRNAGLEFLPDDQAIRLGVQYSFQDWMVESWLRQYTSEADQLMQSLNEPARTTLRVNTLKASRDDCRERLRQEGIETEPTPRSSDGLIATKRFTTHSSPAFKEGWFEIQDEGSQLVSIIADPKPGERVIDVCAGAGGKSLHLAALMGNEGKITAMDVETKRLHELMERAKRAGARSILTQVTRTGDGRHVPEAADLVLVDAPCTGVGTIRRNPGLKWSVAESDVSRYAARQSDILASSAGLVATGGRLVYATCSLFSGENEEVVAWFLDMHREFGVDRSAGSEAGLQSDHGYIRLLPHRHGTDGFFIAVLRRGAPALHLH
jgi:16S rRNA (cytosine967-C5)-methyltransferase